MNTLGFLMTSWPKSVISSLMTVAMQKLNSVDIFWSFLHYLQSSSVGFASVSSSDVSMEHFLMKCEKTVDVENKL